MTFELWEVFLIAVAAFWVGRNVQIWLTVESMKNDPRKMIEILERLDTAQEDEIELIAEVNHGEIFLYRKDTLEFMGQGKTIEEIIERMTQRGDPNSYRISKQMVDRIQAELPK
jgi:hypothetical protein